MARVLGIGIATVDIVNTVDGYPPEDAEVRACAQRVNRGGNATNTLVVLSQLGHRCTWGGVMADDPDARHIRQDLDRYHIDTSACVQVPRGKVPTSYVLLNRRNGSRTIVHYRDLPEFAYAEFEAIDLSGFQWLHFEGRNVKDTRRMLGRARRLRPDLPRSVEVEKARPGMEALFPEATLLLFSRPFARALGHDDPETFLEAMRPKAGAAALVCTWGEKGAWALEGDGPCVHSPAFPPSRVVDTLGAGDTFNAGMIHARLWGQPMGRALATACRLAGRKVGQTGFDGLGDGADGAGPSGP